MGSGWANPRAPGLRGHPQMPLYSSVPAKIALSKRCPFSISNTFFSLVANSHQNNTFHKLMKSELFGCPYNKDRGGLGEKIRICKINGDVPRPKGWNVHKNYVPFDPNPSPPKKKTETGQICRKFVRNHGENFNRYIF